MSAGKGDFPFQSTWFGRGRGRGRGRFILHASTSFNPIVETAFSAFFFESGPGTDNLTATGIETGAPTVGAPAITQAHSLEAVGLNVLGIFDTGIFDTGIFDHRFPAAPTVGTPALTQPDNLTATGISTGAPTVGTPAITQAHALAADGIETGPPTVGTPALDPPAEDTQQQTAGGVWRDWLPVRTPREYPEYVEAKPKRRKKRRPEPEQITLAPDPIIETGIIDVIPAWDVLVELQRIQEEAAIARQQRLRAIALADDEWLMML